MRTEKKKEYDKKYYINNKEKYRELMHTYYNLNKDKIKKYSKEYYEKVKKERMPIWKIKSKKRYLKNRDSSLSKAREHHKKQRIEFLIKIGECKCRICGFSDWRALQIDHVNGDGFIERKKYGGAITRKQQTKLIEENPQNYQILCCNCNWIKKYENKEHAKIRIKTQS